MTMYLSGATLVKNNMATLDHGGGVYVRGGVLGMTASSRVEGNACLLLGGGIFGVQSAVISIAGRAEVVGNRALREGGGVALLSRADAGTEASSRLLVEDSTLEGNTAVYYSGGGISCDLSEVELVNATLRSNVAGASGGGLFGIGGSVHVASKSMVQGNKALEGGGIAVYGGTSDDAASSFLRMNATAVLANVATKGGGLLISNSTRALFSGALASGHASDPSSDDGEANSTTVTTADIWGEGWCGNVTSSVCIVRNEAAQGAAMAFAGSTGNVLQGVVMAANVGFNESDPTSVMELSEGSDVEVNRSYYGYNMGSGFHVTDFSTVTMVDTVMANHTGSLGGALNIDATSAAIVENCVFANGVAKQGGAVYALGNLSMQDSLFQGNAAVASGGAVYIGINKQTTIVNRSAFHSNVAGDYEVSASLYHEGNGGAIFLSTGANYKDAIGNTRLQALSYQGNRAAKGGAVGFWHPHDLRANREPPPCIDCGPLDDSNVAAYGSPEGWATYPLFLQVNRTQQAEASYQKTEHHIIVRIIDSFGETVTSDSLSVVEIHVINPEECNILEGDRVARAMNGATRFSYDTTRLIFKGNPGTTCQVNFSSNLNGLYTADVESNATEVPLRYCETGEELMGDSPWQYCQPCKAGWLSLDNESACTQCEAALDCHGSEACPLECPGRDVYVVCQGSYLAPQAQYCDSQKEASTECLLHRLYTCENSEACTTASDANTCDAEEPGNARRVGRGTSGVAELQLCKGEKFTGSSTVLCGGTLPVICSIDHYHDASQENCLQCGSREEVILVMALTCLGIILLLGLVISLSFSLLGKTQISGQAISGGAQQTSVNVQKAVSAVSLMIGYFQ
eukprot:gene8013-9522_t